MFRLRSKAGLGLLTLLALMGLACEGEGGPPLRPGDPGFGPLSVIIFNAAAFDSTGTELFHQPMQSTVSVLAPPGEAPGRGPDKNSIAIPGSDVDDDAILPWSYEFEPVDVFISVSVTLIVHDLPWGSKIKLWATTEDGTYIENTMSEEFQTDPNGGDVPIVTTYNIPQS